MKFKIKGSFPVFRHLFQTCKQFAEFHLDSIPTHLSHEEHMEAVVSEFFEAVYFNMWLEDIPMEHVIVSECSELECEMLKEDPSIKRELTLLHYGESIIRSIFKKTKMAV